MIEILIYLLGVCVIFILLLIANDGKIDRETYGWIILSWVSVLVLATLFIYYKIEKKK